MSSCLLCGESANGRLGWRTFFLLEAPPSICEACRRRFEPIIGERCRACSRPLTALDPAFIREDRCLDCCRWEDDSLYKGVLAGNYSLYTYNEAMKDFIARFKYRGDYILAQVFAGEIKKAAKQLPHDIAVAIPLSQERLVERGFNQAEALAQAAGLDIEDVLQRVHGEKQSKKSRSERLEAANVFGVKEKSSICHKKVLIIDDIYTTGSTLRQAAYLLKQAGAAEVRALTLARGQGT
ncbi:ComF family protein [Pseudobacillus badius]|uniref:ComF family protein n=1 Tax=Bacillus badius TaxID=1455 RepID=UPI003CF1FFB2